MTTLITHAVVPLALGLGLGKSVIPRRLLALGMVVSILPDLDVIAFRLGIHYADAFGHRGASHSLLCVLALALLASACAPALHASRRATFAFTGMAALSHILLDMFTNGGLGVALFWPWINERFFAPWQFIEVSPLRLGRAFGPRGWVVIQSELRWVWLPVIATSLGLRLVLWQRKTTE